MTPGRARLLAAAVCACTSLLAFGAPAARAATPNAAPYESAGSLPGGGTYIIRRDDLAMTTAMELWFRAPSGGADGSTPGIARLAIAALAASGPKFGTPLSELVNRFGGSLEISVYPDIAMVGVSVPSWDAPQVLRTLTAAYFTPKVSEAGLKSALRDCAVAAAETRFSADRIMQDALFAQLFASGPASYPPTPASAADFTKIPQSAVDAFAQRYFGRANAVLTIAGAADSRLLSNVPAAASSAAALAPLDSKVAAAPAPSEKNGPVPGLGMAWIGPSIADAKAATAMDFVADYLFDSDHGTVARAIERAHPDALVNGQFVTLHDPGVMLLLISGVDVPGVRQRVLDAVAAMGKPLDQTAFLAARNAFEYRLAAQTQTPLSRADNLGWYAAEGNAAYAPGAASGAYQQAIESLDPAFVAQTVRTYLRNPAVVQLVTAQPNGAAT